MTSPGQAFGKHVRSLRHARGLSQEQLAERSGLAVDTIRRLEHGSFSPSLSTLNKLCRGLKLRLSTLFESHELGTREEERDLIDLLAGRSPWITAIVIKVVQVLITELEAIDGNADERDE